MTEETWSDAAHFEAVKVDRKAKAEREKRARRAKKRLRKRQKLFWKS